MINFNIMLRQLVRLYMAMFLVDYVWLQVMVFMITSLAALMHLGYTRPFTNRKENWLSMINEALTLTISYLVMVLVGISLNDAPMH